MAQTQLLTNGLDQVVKSTPGRVHWVQINATGAAIGNRWTLRDGGITGTVIARGTLIAANGSWTFPFVVRAGDPGLRFATNIAFTHDGADNVVHALVDYE